MATSGTVAQTQVNIATLLDTAFRRAGKNPSTVSGEQLEDALKALYNISAALANKGVNLWCIRKSVLNIRADTAAYSMAAGTIDILNVLYRTLNTLDGTPTSGVDFIGITLTTAAAITNVSGSFSAGGTTELVVEYNLGSGWVPLVSFGSVTVEAGSDIATDIQRPIEAAQWRVRDASGNNIVPSSILFRTVNQELNLAQLNRDDYVNLPNKMYSPGGSSKALQYWYDKQINPVLYVWPISQQTLDQLVVYQHGQIEDAGSLTNSMAIPARWNMAFTYQLAAECCLIIPAEELQPGRFELVKGLADTYTAEAGGAESDGSSWRLTPMIGGYTR